MLPKTYCESIIWFNLWWVAKFRQPGVHPTNFDDSPDESEVSTDSEDEEAFDDEELGKEEENDDQALEQIAATGKGDAGGEMEDKSKPEKGKGNKEIDISSKTRGTNLESTDQKGEFATAK